MDHLNKASWRGCVVVNTVNLYNAWTEGQCNASATLCVLGIDANLNVVLKTPQVDLMRPFGDGHYPGVSDKTETQQAPYCCNTSTDMENVSSISHSKQQTDSTSVLAMMNTESL